MTGHIGFVCEYPLFENNDTKTQISETFNFNLSDPIWQSHNYNGAWKGWKSLLVSLSSHLCSNKCQTPSQQISIFEHLSQSVIARDTNTSTDSVTQKSQKWFESCCWSYQEVICKKFMQRLVLNWIAGIGQCRELGKLQSKFTLRASLRLHWSWQHIVLSSPPKASNILEKGSSS